MTIRDKTKKGVLWVLSERIGIKLIGFLITVVLARILTPAEFGVVALVSSFNDILYLFIKGGLGEAVIRKQDADKVDFSTAFVFNIVMSLVCYIGLFIAAPWIADFFHNDTLTLIIRVIGLNLVIASGSFTQVTRFTKEMNFKVQTWANISGLVCGGTVGLIMAFADFGVWALVVQSLTSNFITSLLLMILGRGEYSFSFNIERFRFLWYFGYKLLVAGIMNIVMLNIYVVVIGRFYSSAQIGLYNRANSLRDLYLNNFVHTVQRVSYPALSEVGNDDDQLRGLYKSIIQYTMLATLPVMILSGLMAEEILLFLFGKQWLAAAPYLTFLCIIGALYPLQTINLNILKVKSRSDIFLWLSVGKLFLALGVLWFSKEYGVMGIIVGQIIVAIISLFLNSSFSGKLIRYSLLSQFKDLFPIMAISLTAGLGLFIVKPHLPFEDRILTLFIGILVFVFLFVLLSLVTRQPFIKSIIRMLRNRMV